MRACCFETLPFTRVRSLPCTRPMPSSKVEKVSRRSAPHFSLMTIVNDGLFGCIGAIASIRGAILEFLTRGAFVNGHRQPFSTGLKIPLPRDPALSEDVGLREQSFTPLLGGRPSRLVPHISTQQRQQLAS